MSFFRLHNVKKKIGNAAMRPVPRPRAIFFDLDDTLISLSGSADACWDLVCRRHAATLDSVTAADLFDAVKVSREWSWRDRERNHRGRMDLPRARREIVRNAFAALCLEKDERADIIAGDYDTEREGSIALFAESLEVLQKLRDRGIGLAMITNGASSRQQGKIDRFGLEPYFRNILIEGEFGVGWAPAKVRRPT